jgi:N-acetylneuraminic acid mutarotase
MRNKRAAQSAPVRRSLGEGGFFNRRVLIALAFCAAATYSVVSGTLLAFVTVEAPSKVSHPAVAGLTFAERVAYQRAIEEVYWRHRIWPEERPDPKPSLDAVMSQAQLEKKVEDYLRNSQAIEDYWQRPLTADQLQAEMDRMAKHTKQPEGLRELFAALGNDPFVIAECLARPTLIEHLFEAVQPSQGIRAETNHLIGSHQTDKTLFTGYTLPLLATTSNAEGACIDDTWTPTTITNAPAARDGHTAVWTGSEMIVWGGGFNSGGRYDPSTDSWTATSTTNAPHYRYHHTAVWTGSEMIIWGGGNGTNTGGRYNPGTDTWTATSTARAPAGRYNHTAVWTGSEMIVWGGVDNSGSDLNTGGRYDPSTDSWIDTSITNAPTARRSHTAVWSGSEMIVWSGYNSSYLNTGGRYNPSTNSWTATSITNAPAAREEHTAVWSGSEMIVWGGADSSSDLNTGGRYNPSTDSWTATSITNAPIAREEHTAVWTGTEMIVWGGSDSTSDLNTGGRYCAQPPPTPTPTPNPTPCTGRCAPTPRPSPTSAGRPTPPPR